MVGDHIDAGMEIGQGCIQLGGGAGHVLDDVQLFADVDDEGDNAPDNVFIDGQQQYGSHRETVEHKTGDHDDPGTVDTGIDDFGVQDPEKTAQGKQRYLEAEKLYGQAGRGNACRHPPFFEGKHLHGLAAGGGGGDAGIEHADNRYQQGGAEFDFYVLLPEKNMHAQRFKYHKNAIGNNGCPDPVQITADESNPGIADIAIGSAQINHNANGQKNHQCVQYIAAGLFGDLGQINVLGFLNISEGYNPPINSIA